MDRHRSLYKENSSVLSPRRQFRINRELQHAKENRNKQRKDIYTSARNIEVSPTPLKPQNVIQETHSATSTPFASSNQKTLKPILCVATVVDGKKEISRVVTTAISTLTGNNKTAAVTSRIGKVACTDAKKLSRQEIFLKRFIEWKTTNKKQQTLKTKPPFVPSGVGGNNFGKTSAAATTSSFAPKNHQFKPPVGLKNPSVERLTSNAKLRQSIYTVVPTPPKPKPTPVHTRSNATSLKANNATNAYFKKPVAIVKNTANNILTDNVAQQKKTSAILSNCKSKPGPLNTAATTQAIAKPKDPQNIFVKPRALNFAATRTAPKRPAVAAGHKASAHIVKPISVGAAAVADSNAATRNVGAVGKAKALQNKRAEAVQPIRRKPNLSICMKAKKPSGVVTNIAATAVKRSTQLQPDSKNFLKAIVNTLMVAETPTDLANANPFEAFVTSTKVKESSASDFPNICDDISSIKPQISTIKKEAAVVKRTNSSAAKRALLQDEALEKPKYKFNFKRYSEAPYSDLEFSTLKSPVDDDDNERSDEEQPAVLKQQVTSQQQTEQEGHKEEQGQTVVQKENTLVAFSPVRLKVAETTLCYLSPYVSVSRGKVSLREERARRDSVYLQTPPAPTASAVKNAETLEERRTLETVRYFRKQLDDEIFRLHALCDQWQAYKAAHLARLQGTNGEDMIDVTIGQTKLLTSKKFMQFKELIERCEARAKGVGPINDGSEKTKPIFATDLEAFWSMLGLQVENLEKRFKNLERWQANDWCDPDELVVKLEKKNNLKKVQKVKVKPVATKARPSSALQQMLRKMHADMRKQKATTAATDDNNIKVMTLTPDKQRRSLSGTPTSTRQKRISTPRRTTIIVPDRKAYSPAATVLSIPMPTKKLSTHRASIMQQRKSIGSPKLLRSLANFQKECEHNELLKTTLINAEFKKRNSKTKKSITPKTPPQPSTPACSNARKSILKTPGTAKSKPKNVIFNQNLFVKKFTFTVDGDESDNDEQEAQWSDIKQLEQERTAKEDLGSNERAYKLRTRKVVLRPSCEIVIPK